jgi:orotidine-5'-phosphate decarboxylase
VGVAADARQAALMRGAFVQSNADAVVLWPYGREAALTAAAIPPGRFVFFESPAEEPMYALHHMAQWSVAHPGQIGLVAHASRLQNLSALRKRMPGVPFLIRAIPPAGEIAAVVRAATPAEGPRPILCAGADVLYASRTVEYQDDARAAALTLRDRINAGV